MLADTLTKSLSTSMELLNRSLESARVTWIMMVNSYHLILNRCRESLTPLCISVAMLNELLAMHL